MPYAPRPCYVLAFVSLRHESARKATHGGGGRLQQQEEEREHGRCTEPGCSGAHTGTPPTAERHRGQQEHAKLAPGTRLG